MLFKADAHLLLFQLGLNSESSTAEAVYESILASPSGLEANNQPLWNKKTIPVLQKSVHIDNFLALQSGQRIQDSDASIQPCSDIEQSVFSQQKIIELKSLQRALSMEFSDKMKFSHFSSIRFLGCVSEEVRSTLQGSFTREETSPDRDWNPRICTASINLYFSTQLIDRLTEL
eukprot:IDg18869t1